MANAIDKAVRAQGGGVVKPNQVTAMILAARRAYKAQSELGLVDDGVDFDAWRRATLHDVTGPASPDSFRAVTQRDYAAVIAYFGELAGDEVKSAAAQPLNRPAAFKDLKPRSGDLKRSDLIQSDEQARALWTLNLVEGEVAGTLGGREGARRYADALFRKIHKTNRFAATARQVWAVIFTLRNRASRKREEARLEAGVDARHPRRSKTALGARGEAGVHLPPPDGSKRFPAFSRGL